jgi:hypothetical protein
MSAAETAEKKEEIVLGTVTTTIEDMEALVAQFSKMGVQFALNCVIKFINKIEQEYPKVPKDDFLKLAIETFKENNIQIDTKIPVAKPRIKDENRCSKILQTGKNKGMKCSLPKMEGSEYCKRHRNQILTSSSKKQSQMIGDYLKLLQPKTSDIKKATPLKLRQYQNENIYLETETNIMFRKVKSEEDEDEDEDETKDEFVAFGIYIPSKGIAELSKEEKAICERNSWKYEK